MAAHIDFMQNNEVSSDIVQALRQAVDAFAANARSHPASSPVSVEIGGRKFKPSSSKRQQLTAEEAAEIYKMRPKPEGKGKRPKRGSMIRCKAIAPKYGVSAKTIRDIWRGRTWIEATRYLWTREEKNRRAINGEENSDSEYETTDDRTSELHTFAPASALANSIQMQYFHPMGNLQATGNQDFRNDSSKAFPNIPQTISFERPQQQLSSNFSSSFCPANAELNPQLLQQKILMLELALSSFKTTVPTQFSMHSSGLGAPTTSFPMSMCGPQNFLNQFSGHNFPVAPTHIPSLSFLQPF